MDEEKTPILGQVNVQEQGKEDERSAIPHKTYNGYVGTAICINYIIGTGVFSLPHAFSSSGVLLGIILLLVGGIFSTICINFVLEVMARAEGVTAIKENRELKPNHEITWRRFDFTVLCEIFGGLKGKIVCQILMAMNCYGGLWAYSAVFAATVSSLIFQFGLDETCDLYNHPSSKCQMAYYLTLVGYGLVVVPLSCMDLGEQVIVQMAMTAYRFSAFAVMLITVIIGLCNDNPFSEHMEKGVADVSLVKWAGFATMFTSAAVATNFHYNVPDVVKPLRNKSQAGKMVSGALGIAVFFYAALGIICSLYFGSSASALVTMNWSTYTGMQGGWGGDIKHRPLWAKAVQLWVMMFPVLDMLSVFPLFAISLGNNLLQTVPTPRFVPPRLMKILWRLIASIPPLILAAAVGKLDSIFDFTGLTAFFLELIIPCLMQIGSIYYCRKWFGKGSEWTPYSGFYSYYAVAGVTLIFGVSALGFAISVFVRTYL
eukprot:TRINITY_DN3269_c0_g2_i2.p1 TRINITY_DN3269_c0_g2~~TRINITY_DN3269_c0_g2_i2.p1  ORF type:complete len:486 (-),score=108.49 TRINITY_DN3269_c0_g2_i2:80-1537(-)